MLINQLKKLTIDQIPNKNPSLKRYFSLSTNEKNAVVAFNTNAAAGQLIAFQLNKQLKSDFSEEKFIQNVLEHFKQKITEENYVDIIKRIYFSGNSIPVLTPLMYMATPLNALDNKTKKSLNIFEQLMNTAYSNIDLQTDLNFIEEEIYSKFLEEVEVKQRKNSTDSYLSFIKNVFSKDFLFLLQNQHYFKNEIDRFLKFYLFIYSAQLALNIHTSPLEEPESKELYFILNHEKASSERKNTINFGYKILIDKVRYIFPYLSLLETLTEITGNKNLKIYHFNNIENTQENIAIIDKLTRIYREAKSLPKNSFLSSTSIEEAIQTLLNSTMEQFRTDKKAVLDRFINAFEKQISGDFFQLRGRSGKVLVLDQDMILLLTNLAIGGKGQLRFQELMDEFKTRSIYFDPKSHDALLELYERVGNVDRKSDSGDAVYVKAI